MTYVPPTAPPMSQVIDFASLCYGIDPTMKAPPVVYIYDNRRKFLEFTSDVAVNVYQTENGSGLYYQSGTSFTFYGRSQ